MNKIESNSNQFHLHHKSLSKWSGWMNNIKNEQNKKKWEKNKRLSTAEGWKALCTYTDMYNYERSCKGGMK